MKTSFFFRCSTVLLILLSARSSFAQEVTRIDTLPVIVITAKSPVPQKVRDAFKKDFKGATNPRWYKIDENFIIKFMTQDQKNHALYHKNGLIYYHIAYGTEKHLPENIKDQIKRSYSGAKITTVIHVSQDNRNIWLANLEMGKLLILVREEDGNFQEVERVKNASM